MSWAKVGSAGAAGSDWAGGSGGAAGGGTSSTAITADGKTARQVKKAAPKDFMEEARVSDLAKKSTPILKGRKENRCAVLGTMSHVPKAQ